MSAYVSGFAGLLRRVADRIQPEGAPRMMTSHTFTFELGEGARFREDGRGCPLWYFADDYARAHDEADSAPELARRHAIIERFVQRLELGG